MKKEKFISGIYVILGLVAILLIASLFFMSQAVSEKEISKDTGLQSGGVFNGLMEVLGIVETSPILDEQILDEPILNDPTLNELDFINLETNLDISLEPQRARSKKII
jgi:hypothetical protein